MENELAHIKAAHAHAAQMQMQVSGPFAPGQNLPGVQHQLSAVHDMVHAMQRQNESHAAERQELLRTIQKQHESNQDLMQKHTELMQAHKEALKTMQSIPASAAAAPQQAAVPGPGPARGSEYTTSMHGHGTYRTNSAQKLISNRTKLTPPKDPSIMDNTLLFIPPSATWELRLEPNMDDKGDKHKTMWFGRVWELRELLLYRYADKMSKILDSELNLSEVRKRELQLLMQNERVVKLLKKLAARWKGAAYRSHCSLRLLDRLKYCNIPGTLVYAHGSGGCSWDNFRICRMIAKTGILVIAPDGFAYPKDTAMGALRHKDTAPLHQSDDDVDYWANDLLYTSSAVGTFNYSTKAETVLQQPDEYKELYEKCYQLRRSELHFTCARLPMWVKRQGFFLGGTSEGAMTIARFDDQRYGNMVRGRFINSFSIEYCYFTPSPEAGELGGNKHTPTLNIIGTKDQYFGPESVASIVAADANTGYGNPNLTGNGFETMVRQGIDIGLVCVLEDGVHSPCNTHDNFLRALFMVFFTRTHQIWMLEKIWRAWSDTKDLVRVTATTKDPEKKGEIQIQQVFVPKPKYPNRMSLEEVESLRLIGAQDTLTQAMEKEAKLLQAEYGSIRGHLDRVKAEVGKLQRQGSKTTHENYYAQGDLNKTSKHKK
eukprot:TRINITY_DN79242_c0_g1_i1.p1 TRINITY_DN79242_c0_g1~~TRINITY_DN79242_c0_g1_i1.p1  ORF type:complete len:701 (+),score=112.63 TRINITY_DN79242_c0_g1_i1:133-2103(+)